MSAAMSLYERLRGAMDEQPSGMSLARARGERQDKASSLFSSVTPVEIPQVTTSTPEQGADSLSARIPQVTTSTPCQHVTDPELREWFAENPKLTCARCWLESHRPQNAGRDATP